ncbi:uncharacterized protein OE_6280R (plasmid) [Halobacterium salinarum R1]|uniref:Uncharacterized protein n=1 Tax=Halobacterium salinarum (strain ATCC 29341 / DSM 671 / R1) TaxID=478009 RepID=B0R980_HALS3|nr:uncharacterized protein OE_6280R [Halobacterium salinarum R1]
MQHISVRNGTARIRISQLSISTPRKKKSGSKLAGYTSHIASRLPSGSVTGLTAQSKTQEMTIELVDRAVKLMESIPVPTCQTRTW